MAGLTVADLVFPWYVTTTCSTVLCCTNITVILHYCTTVIHRIQIWPSNNFCLDSFSRKEIMNNDKDQVKISHYVHFQDHILMLGEVIAN